MRTVRVECLDWMLVLGRRQLEVILGEYVGHYNERRPHRGLGLGVPPPSNQIPATPPPLRVRRRERTWWSHPRVRCDRGITRLPLGACATTPHAGDADLGTWKPARCPKFATGRPPPGGATLLRRASGHSLLSSVNSSRDAETVKRVHVGDRTRGVRVLVPYNSWMSPARTS